MTKDIQNKEEAYQCIGCGAYIQTDHPELPGYTPQSAYEKGLTKGEFYCQRCFRLRHYNEIQNFDVSEYFFLEQLDKIGQDEEAFVFHLVDIFDLEGSLLTGLNRFTGNKPFILVANKIDLLPKSVKLGRIQSWLTQRFHALDLYPQDVILLSAKKGASLDQLIEVIQDKIQNHNIYTVGVTNVGKSSVINHVLKDLGEADNLITTSAMPGTTLEFIELPLTEDHALIDTPGIIRSQQITHYLDREGIKVVLPDKMIKPRSFQLDSGQTIFFAGLGRLDFERGDKTSFTFYVSNNLLLHRTKTEKADQLLADHQGQLLSPPQAKDQLPAFKTYHIQLQANQDLAIAGLGWVTVNQAVSLSLQLPQGVTYAVRPAMI
ncbi:ribosome biogenesis GTPase YqeH [Eremococcus coleocola]|uniref:Ribosome biogenesis GTPase YqeH n=1 Tax=Eremococcus coleocola ACS-139-V-Col8 TaxID=908337 RepID=E4KPC2_9LACT|nr:ribosome biogenesis GTPase YqeH [Eremococcus coleocola]EFR31017.1 ribosome biogenesis GTPase YqeH [Eremococcus coleocola ACS-139-V-Col8]